MSSHTQSRIAIILLVLLAGTACGPEMFHRDRSGDAGGASGSGAGGDASDGGAGGASGGGAGGADGGVDAAVDRSSTLHDCDPRPNPPETCGGVGCARLCIPRAAAGTGTIFAITIPTTDMTGVSGVFRLCIAAGLGQDAFVQPFAQEGASPFSSQFDTSGLAGLAACPAFSNITFVFDHSQWNYRQTQTIGLKLHANSASTIPLVAYVDSITLSRGGGDGGDGGVADAASLPGPYTFDVSAAPFLISTYLPVPDSSVGWVP